MAEQPFELSRFPVHLGLGATVEHLPEFDGSPDWYQRYGAAHESDGVEGRLVSWHTADIDGPVTALFITAGVGTEIRPR